MWCVGRAAGQGRRPFHAHLPILSAAQLPSSPPRTAAMHLALECGLCSLSSLTSPSLPGAGVGGEEERNVLQNTERKKHILQYKSFENQLTPLLALAAYELCDLDQVTDVSEPRDII